MSTFLASLALHAAVLAGIHLATGKDKLRFQPPLAFGNGIETNVRLNPSREPTSFQPQVHSVSFDANPPTPPDWSDAMVSEESEESDVPSSAPRLQMTIREPRPTMRRDRVQKDEAKTRGNTSAPPLEAVPTVNPRPEYPRLALSRGYEGEGELEVEVSVDGSCTGVSIVRSTGYEVLDRAMVNTVATRWRFQVARREGRPVPSITRIPFEFRLVDP